MPIRYAALYITLGVALGLCLHVMINKHDAEAGRAAPAFPISTVDTDYV